MSMRTYGITVKGLLIPKQMLGYVMTHTEDWDELSEENKSAYKYNYLDYYYDCYKIGNNSIVMCSNCSGDLFDIEELDYSQIPENEYDKNCLVMLELQKYPSLFSQAYKDIDEIVKEYKLSVGKYFPENFDFKKYLVTFVGTYEG